MFNKKQWPELVELIFIIAAIIGSFGLLTGQPITYAAIPGAFALGLNWLNRQLLAQQIRKNSATNKSLTQQHQADLDQLMDQLQRTISTLNISSGLAINPNPQLAQELQSLMAVIQNLLERQNLLEKTLSMMQSELEIVVQAFQKRPELDQMNSLTHVIVDLQQFINQLPQWGNLQQHQMNELHQKVEQSLEKLSTEIDNIPNQIEQEVKRQVNL
jgi:DNA-binding HxlR family transcriptional regulator